MNNLVIAIDGHSACGKSTLAKALAKKLNLVYIDTGAMYRAVTAYFLENSIDIFSERDVIDALECIDIHFETIFGENICFLNGKNVEDKIRSKSITENVSEVSAISAVRKKLVSLQRVMGENNDIVMDGRDIGSVVFPNANFKFFLTASPEIRAQRRLDEYKSKGIIIQIDEVLDNLKKRDFIDSNRKDSPLKVAKGAVVIDNSNLTREEQLDLILDIINA